MVFTGKDRYLERFRCAEGASGIGLLDCFLTEIHRRISLTDAERSEAENRLRILASVLLRQLGGSVYALGSVVHGDAMSPLNDIDVGIVVGTYEQSCRLQLHAPAELVEWTRSVLIASLREEYPYLTATLEGQRRSILIEFDHKVANPGLGRFTADVIVALKHESGRGILIPNLVTNSWDRSDPKTHTALIHQAARASNNSFIEIVRLAKYWSRSHGMPLYSWNIKALALKSVARPLPLTTGLRIFFDHAAESIATELTPDPAGVSSPIRLGMPRRMVISHLDTARASIDRAIRNAGAARYAEAVRVLGSLFNDDAIPLIHHTGS
jgi:hypothetical protein